MKFKIKEVTVCSLEFKKWLMKEVSSSTSCVAAFQRPIGGIVTRKNLKLINGMPPP